MKRTNSLHTMSLLIASLALVAGLYLPAHDAEALTVSPARMELEGDPGQVVESKFLIVNEENQSKTFYSTSENFEARGETGSPHFIIGDNGLASWVEVAEAITLAPLEQREVSFRIRIPTDADPGGHFAAIFWSTTPVQDSGDTQVSIGAKLGVLLLLRISGDVTEGGGIVEFSSEKRFYTYLPIAFNYRFQNTGGDRLRPEGEIRIRNTAFLTADRVDANVSKGNILPNSTRRFDVVWSKSNVTETPKGFFSTVGYQWKNFGLGWYTAQLNVVYGAEGLVAKDSFGFLVFPWQLMLVLIIGGGIALFVIIKILGSYNRMIIERARNQSGGNGNDSAS